MMTKNSQGDYITSSAINNKPFVVAVVLNWNGFEDTVRCLRSLCNTNYSNLQIIVVDNASTDGSQKNLHQLFPEIPLITQSMNGGYAVGNNAGIHNALQIGADYILILNNDIVVDTNFLTPLVDLAEQHSDIGIVTGLIRYQSDPNDIYYAAGRFSKWLCTGVNISKLKNDIYFSGPIDVSFVNGSFFLVKRNVLEELGLIDESYFMYFEDLELSRRIANRYRLIYTPQSVVYHKSGAGKGIGTYSETYLYYHTRNRFLVFKNEPLPYRIYVLMYTVVNSIAKSIFLMINVIHGRNQTIRQLKALWQGVRDGIFMVGTK